MRSLVVRRSSNIASLLGVTVAAAVIYGALSISLYSASYWSGWSLLTIILLLALYSVRKRLACVPFGSSSLWLQSHVYVGLFSCVVFVLHVGIRVPNGLFESLLAAVYVMVFVSGVLGLLISRFFARRLTARGREVVYERIPHYRQRLQDETEKLLSDRFGDSENGPVQRFYLDHLRPHFERPRHFFHHLLDLTLPLRVLLTQMSVYQRFLDEDERAVMNELEAYVRMKDDLDYQYALQFVLKHWPFIHVPLTHCLLLLSLYHALLVHAFSGSS